MYTLDAIDTRDSDEYDSSDVEYNDSDDDDVYTYVMTAVLHDVRLQ